VSNLSASDKVRQKIIHLATGEKHDTAESICDAWDDLDGHIDLQDYESEVRGGKYKTDIPCESSWPYESESVAAEMMDGSYVGWTYWFGGGKHSQPESMPWIESAYDLDMKEVMVVQKVFTKRKRRRK
jgi:hypothetical protein